MHAIPYRCENYRLFNVSEDNQSNTRRTVYGPRQANLVLIAYASSEGSGEPAHPCSLARTFAARSYKQWIKRNLQTESQIPAPSEWLGMRSKNLSWRNARRHKFVWRGSIISSWFRSEDKGSDYAFYYKKKKLHLSSSTGRRKSTQDTCSAITKAIHLI